MPPKPCAFVLSLLAATTLFAAPACTQDAPSPADKLPLRTLPAPSPADKMPLRVLPAPPTTATYAKSAAPAKTRLRLVSKTANADDSYGKWFARNRLRLPDYGVRLPYHSTLSDNRRLFGDPLPPGSPMTYGGDGLCRALPGATKDTALFLYGNDAVSTWFLVKAKPNGDPVYALDFRAYLKDPNADVYMNTDVYVIQGLRFALEDAGGTLFVAHAAGGDAKESHGKTGYITALEPQTGKMLWRSAPLTHSADTFVQTGDALICGYGSNDERNFLYVLDKRTGKRVQTISLQSRPEYILRRDDRVYILCNDTTNYVFAVK